MSIIDERVVEMRFDNRQFESAANQSLSTLQKLSMVIDNTTSADNVARIADSIDGINFGSAVSGVESLADRFSALGIVAKRVLENITDTLMGKLTNAITSVTGSIVSGGIKRAMNIENAHFQLQGLISDETEVQAIMQDAMDSVDGTAYAYDEAAKAASMFAATGLTSGKQMQNALKAIAGVAATTNSDYESLSQIFTTVAGQGRLMADQLNQLAVRGMNGAAALTKYFNSVNDGTVEATDSVKKAIKEVTKGTQITEADLREFVRKGQVSFEMFSEGMATTFGDHAKDANETFTGAMANIRAALARTGAMFVSPLLTQNGKFVELFNTIRVKINEVNKVLGPFAKDVTDVINRIVEGLTKLVKNLNIDPSWSDKLQHGFTKVLDAAKALMDILKPIKEAFTEAFGDTISGIFSDLGNSINNAFSDLKVSEETIVNLKDGFKGIFDVIDLLIDAFVRLLKAISPTSDAIETFNNEALNLFGDIGRGLSTFVKWVKESEAFNNVFETITDVVTKATRVLKDFIIELGDKAETGFDKFGEKFKKLSDILDKFKNGGMQVLEGLWKMVTPFIDAIKKLGEELWKVLTAIDPLEAFIAFCNGKFMAGITNSFGKLAETVTHVLLDTILVSISNFILRLQELMLSITNFDSLVNGLQKLSQALLVLAGACFVLSTIDDKQLKSGMVALTAFLTELIAAMAILTKISQIKQYGFNLKEKEFNSFYSLTDEIKNLAIAVGILAAACKVLGSMSFEDLAKGMTMVTTFLVELTAVGIILNKRGINEELARVGSTLIMMSVSLLILTKAVKELGSLDIKSLAKGVASIGALILEMSIFTKLADGRNTSKAGFALIEMAGAILILVKAVKEFASMNLKELAKGLVAIGVALAEMVLALNLMPAKKNVSKAFAMIEFAAALVIIAQSLKMLADLSPNGLVNAVVAMGAVILEMVIALQIMQRVKWANLDALAIIGMAFALVKISEALVPLTQVDDQGLLNAVIAMGAIILEMTICLQLLAKVKGVAIDTLAIIGMAFALVKMSEALAPLTQFNFAELLSAVIALGLMLFTMAGVLAVLASVGPVVLAAGAAAVLMGITAELMVHAFKGMIEAIAMIKDMKLSEAEKDMDAFLKFLLKLEGVLAVGGVLSPLIAAFSISMGMVAASLSVSGIMLAKSMMIFTPALTQLSDAIQKLNNVECENFVKNAEPVALAIAELGLALKTFGPWSVIGATAFYEIAEGINKLVDPLTKFSKLESDKLNNTFIDIANGIKEFGKSLKGFGLFSGIGSSALNEVADAIQKFAPALVTLSDIPGAKINSIMTSLASGFEMFGKSLDTYDIFSSLDAKALTTFADAVAKMAEPLVLLSDIPGAKINSTLIALAAGFREFGSAIEATPFWGSQGRSKALLNLCDGINKISDSIPKLNDIDSETLLSKMTTIGNGFKKFGEALDAAPLFNSSGRAGGITALCDSIHNLADGITYFMNTTSEYKDNVETTLESIGNAFKVFGEALSSAPLIGSSARGEGIAVLVNNIITLADGVEDFSSRDFSDFTFATNKIASAFKAFGQALCEAPLIGADTRGEGIVTLVNSLSTLADGISEFAEISEADNFNDALIKIRIALISFAEALDNTPWLFVEARAGGIGSIVSNIKTLAEGVNAFTNLDYTQISLLDQLGKTLGDFGKAIDETPFWDNEGRADAIVRVIDALNPLVDSAVKMAGKDGAASALQGFSSSISGLGNALSNNWSDIDTDMISSLEKTINVLNNIASINSNNLSTVNTTVSETITWLKELSTLDLGSVDAVTNLATQFTNSMNNLSTTLVVVGNSFVDSWLTGIKQKTGEVTTVATELGNAFIKQLETFRIQFFTVSTTLFNEFRMGIQNKQAEIITVATNLGNQIIETLNGLQNQFYSVGQVLINRFISSINDCQSYATTAGTTLGTAVIDALNSLYGEFVNVGSYVVDGFVEGINANMDKAIDAGTSLGQAAYSAAQSALGVASPSKKFKYLGKMSGQGLINGLINQSNAAKKAGYSLGESSFDGLKNAIDSIYDYMDDYMDMNPTITPRVDMSEIQKATDETSNLFNNAIAVSANNVSGISDRLSNFTYNQNEQLSKSIGEQTKDNADVVTAIGSLNDEVATLKDVMANLQVVLDTGTMVGAMTPAIDHQLGMRKMLAGRGI